jgi:hypothetical protein
LPQQVFLPETQLWAAAVAVLLALTSKGILDAIHLYSAVENPHPAPVGPVVLQQAAKAGGAHGERQNCRLPTRHHRRCLRPRLRSACVPCTCCSKS